MKEIRFFCDACGKEFPPESYSFYNGQTVKMDKELKVHALPFEGHYCGDCTEKILSAIHKLCAKQEGDNKLSTSSE